MTVCLPITQQLLHTTTTFSNNYMKEKFIIAALVLSIFGTKGFSQQLEQNKSGQSSFTVSLSGGWTHYVDNLEYGNKNLNQNFAGFNFRFYWEPEHRLSLGAETGLITLFKAKSQPGSVVEGDVTRKVIPLFLLIRMRTFENFYLGTGFGVANLNNVASYNGQTLKTSTLSFANYQFSASYIYPLSSHWQLGGEAKVYEFGAFTDWVCALQLFCVYRF